MGDRAGVQQLHDFGLSVELADGVPLVTVAGDVDLYSAPELRDRLVRLADDGATRIVLDLSRATFLDSMALGVLLSTKKRLAGELELVVPTPEVRRIFEITMLDRIFALYETREDALRGGGAQPSSASSSEE